MPLTPEELDPKLSIGIKAGIDMCTEYLQRWADNIDTLPISDYNMTISWLVRKAARDMLKMKDKV